MIEEPTSTSLKASLLSVEQPSSAFTSLEKTLFDMRSDCEMQEKDFEMLQQLEGNTLCIDCGTANPDWGSPSLGILFCFQCSGQHRGLGTHISFVRSVTLDQWTDQQMALMRIGGNNQCRSFMETHGMDFHSLDIRQRYDSPAAALYRQVLLARSQGKPEPTELLETANQTRPQVCLKDKIQGFGSSPMPEPESEVSLKMSAFILLLSLTAGAGLAVYFWR
jgi:ADP-ribosylation factor GTPase-activating protein 1